MSLSQGLLFYLIGFKKLRGKNMSDHILVGKVITGIKIAKDKQVLLFVTTDGNIKALCYGDCCSETWIEHIEMPALCLPAKILGVRDLEMPDLGNMPGRNFISYYGLKISTDKGDIVIDYRNDSNGYYCGNLLWPDSNGLYCGYINKDSDWVQIGEEGV